MLHPCQRVQLPLPTPHPTALSLSYRKAVYGPNVISVPVKSYPQLLVDEVGLSWPRPSSGPV